MKAKLFENLKMFILAIIVFLFLLFLSVSSFDSKISALENARIIYIIMAVIVGIIFFRDCQRRIFAILLTCATIFLIPQVIIFTPLGELLSGVLSGIAGVLIPATIFKI